jgi:hypothetical protein
MSPPKKQHLELEIKTLQNAPRDLKKLERLLKVKRQKEEAMHIEVTEILVKEIEMLKVVLYLVCRKDRETEREGRGKEEVRAFLTQGEAG